MIKGIEKVVNVGDTKLYYRKKETMTGLYFKEMLSKLSVPKDNEDHHNKQERHNTEDKKEHKTKEEINKNLDKGNEIEGILLDKLC